MREKDDDTPLIKQVKQAEVCVPSPSNFLLCAGNSLLIVACVTFFCYLCYSGGGGGGTLKKEFSCTQANPRHWDSGFGASSSSSASSQPDWLISLDPQAALAVLEHLVDIARDKADQRASRFSVVLCNTPIAIQPSLSATAIKTGGRQGGLCGKGVPESPQDTPTEPFPWNPRERPVPYSRHLLPVGHIAGSADHNC